MNIANNNIMEKILIVILLFALFLAGSYIVFWTKSTKNYVCNDCSIVVITLTTFRADHLGIYGYQQNTSPNIDEFAKENIQFKNFYNQITYTVPSQASLLTSLYPFNHGVYTEDDRISNSTLTLPQILKFYNYTTAAFMSFHTFSKEIYGNGFDVFDAPFANTNYYFRSNSLLGRRNASETLMLAENWMSNNSNEKFFLLLNFFDTHCIHSICDISEISNNEKANLTKIVIGTYDKQVSYIDHNIGNLLGYLKSHNLYNKTIIIITSDHGEAFGEHGTFGHANEPPYAEQTYIPFLIHLPSFTSKVISIQGETVDIMPTILDILNITRPQELDGKTLLPLIINNIPVNNYTYSEWPSGGFVSAFRTDKWEIMIWNNQTQLFNLDNDRFEQHDVIDSNQEIAQNMLNEFYKWKNETQHKYTRVPIINSTLIGYP